MEPRESPLDLPLGILYVFVSAYWMHGCVLFQLFSSQDLGLQPEDNFVLKVVQLEELIHVRHSVFVIGNAGTGMHMY